MDVQYFKPQLQEHKPVQGHPQALNQRSNTSELGHQKKICYTYFNETNEALLISKNRSEMDSHWGNQ